MKAELEALVIALDNWKTARAGDDAERLEPATRPLGARSEENDNAPAEALRGESPRSS